MALIPLKWQIRGVVVLAIVLGLFGFHTWSVRTAENKMRLERLRSRLETIKKSQEISRDTSKLTADEILRRSRKWVHPSD